MAMPENHGGARDGAGRTSNAEKYSGPIATFTDAAAAYLPEAFLNLQALAEGSERVEVKELPAGMVTRKDVARDADGVPILDAKGKLTVIDVRVYPDRPEDELVVVERKRLTLPPDTRANEYLGNRVMGKPRQALEHSGPEGGPIPVDLKLLPSEDLVALERIAQRLTEGRPEAAPG